MRYSTTLILALLVAVIAIVVWVFREDLWGPETEIEQPDEKQALVRDVELDDVTSAELLERDGDGLKPKVAFTRDGDPWHMTTPVDAATDGYEVRRLVRAALEAKVRERLTPGGNQPTAADLDLEPPAYRLVLEAKDEKTITLDVGRRPALGGGLYVRLKGETAIARLERDDLLERARADVSTYRTRSLVDLATEDVVQIEMARADGTIVARRAAEGENRWVLAGPLSARADPDAMSDLLRDALGIRVKEFIADAPEDLAAYGLAEPRLSVTLFEAAAPEPEEDEADEDAENAEDELEAGTKKKAPKADAAPVPAVTLRFGSWADLKQDSVYLAADNTVVSVATGTYNRLNRSADDLRSKHVLALDADRVTWAEVRHAEGAFELEKREGAWHVKPADGEATRADASTVDTLLEELAELEVLYFLGPKEAADVEFPADAPGVRLRLEDEAGQRGFQMIESETEGARVRNLREPWIGRLNEKTLDAVGKGWLAYVTKDVVTFEPDRATRFVLATPDRTVEAAQTDGTWRMTAPVEADLKADRVRDLLNELLFLRPEKYVARTEDFAAHGLDPAPVRLEVTVAPAGDEGEPETRVLHVAIKDDGTILGRTSGHPFVFEVRDRALQEITGELLEAKMTDLAASAATGILVEAGGKTLALAKREGTWFRKDANGNLAEEIDDAAARDVAEAVADAEVVRWASYEAKDPGRFGLSEPALRITVTTEDGRTTLLISDQEVDPAVAKLFDRRPARYAMVEGGEKVGILAGPKLQPLLDAPKAAQQ